MPKYSAVVDEVFHALADPTRRNVVERLEHGPSSTGELHCAFSMSLPSFTHHLAVLEDAGVVTSTKQGRVRTYQLAPDRLRVAEGWLVTRALRHWERRLDQLDDYLHCPQGANAMTPSPTLNSIQARPRARAGGRRPRRTGLGRLDEQPEHLVKWFTPAPWTTTDCEIDLRPGGLFRTIMRSPEGKAFPNIGCYLEVVPNERLVWTVWHQLPGYRPAENPPHSFPFTAAITLERTATGTRYRALAIHADPETCKQHASSPAIARLRM